MKQFPATEPLAFVAIYILCKLIRTKNRNRLLLARTYLFTKLTRTVTLKRIKATAVAHGFLLDCVSVYGPSKTVLSNNGNQFLAWVFTEM